MKIYFDPRLCVLQILKHFAGTFSQAETTYFWRAHIVGSCRMLLYMCILLCPKIALSICKAQFSIIAFESWKVSPRLLLSHREIRILSKCVVEFKKYRISVVNSYLDIFHFELPEFKLDHDDDCCTFMDVI